VTYLAIYPRLQNITVKRIALFDIAVTGLCLIVSGVLFWGKGIKFSMLLFSTNWVVFTLLSAILMEAPLYHWFCQRMGLKPFQASKEDKETEGDSDDESEPKPKTIDEVEELFQQYEIESYFDKIKPLAKPKIDLTLVPTDESKFTAAISKIGGQPHLPEHINWPTSETGKSLSFIGQLNFKEVSEFDRSGLLPKEGLALFFYCADQDSWGFDPKNRQRFKVVYTDDASTTAKRAFPADLGEDSVFEANGLNFESTISLPTLQDDCIDGLIEDEDSDNYIEATCASENQILGYANCIQNSMELQCQLVTNGLYCGDSTGYEDPRRMELESGKKDWLLLLQIDSDEEKSGMIWGDSGRLYFWIKKDDLLNKNFDEVWCILQCY
jgi:uncharacterized protein YwqG